MDNGILVQRINIKADVLSGYYSYSIFIQFDKINS